MDEMIDWWVNLHPLTDKEKETLFQTRFEEKVFVDDSQYKELSQNYFNLLPFCNITCDDYVITFDESGTKLLTEIIDNNVDDETLIICSDVEHPNVKKKIKSCKNYLIVSYYDEIIKLNYNKINNIAKNYKKVFVYMIGTQISTGEITPQLFLKGLKERFDKMGIQSKFMLDDVHGMFFVPRDYRMFDYILYTTHALINKYDMGVLISRDGKYGEKIYNQGLQYLEMLKIILSRKDKIIMFNDVMSNYFRKEIASGEYELFKDNARHLFTLRTNNLLFSEKIHDILTKFHIRLEGKNNKTEFLLLRSARFIKNPEYLIEGLKLFNEYMDVLKVFI